VFNLVKYRYWFLLASLIVIIPGLISLAIFHLNVGIDFAGGSSIDLRPQRQMTDVQVENLIKTFNLKSPQIVLGTNNQIDGSKNIWVRLNTQIDDDTQNAFKAALNKQYNKELSYDFTTVPQAGEKPFTLVSVTGFQDKPQVSDIRTALAKLPATTDPNAAPASATTSSATPTAAATASATPKANATPKATVSPVIKPTQSGVATTQVTVQDVSQGTTNQTINILTLTTIGKANSGNGANNQTNLPAIQAAFLKNGGPYFQVVSNSLVGPSVAGETTLMAFLAVLAASVFILLYVWFSFRKVPKAWRYGTCAIVALLHDVLVVLGIFSILGVLFSIQIDALFITGLLTVIGFSVHDTIVVFDRIRENMQRRTSETFEEVVNASLVQTMARSLNTSLTVLLTLLALTLFTGVGTSIFSFTLTLLIGIFSGTYSSIFNASMLLVIWENGELGLDRLKGRRDQMPVRREARELARTRG
jgi:preprotein translocase SecF subunit